MQGSGRTRREAARHPYINEHTGTRNRNEKKKKKNKQKTLSLLRSSTFRRSVRNTVKSLIRNQPPMQTQEDDRDQHDTTDDATEHKNVTSSSSSKRTLDATVGTHVVPSKSLGGRHAVAHAIRDGSAAWCGWRHIDDPDAMFLVGKSTFRECGLCRRVLGRGAV